MDGAQSLILNGLAQSDLDMAGFRLLNLDTSNLPPSGIPPTVNPPPHNWLDSWDSSTMEWGYSQPGFEDLSGFLTNAQMTNISRVGTLLAGTWQASEIAPLYLPRLHSIRPPTENVSMNNNRLTNVADPISPGDAVNKGFMDLLLEGLNPKGAVRVATTTAIGLFGLPTIDGIALVAGDRVLVKDITAPSGRFRNGIWIAAAGVWTRATDADHGTDDPGVNTSNDINRAYCVVLEGTVNAGTAWFEFKAVGEIDVDDVGFILFSTATDIVAGFGLSYDGNTLNVGGTTDRIEVTADAVDIAATYAGQTSITTLGTIGIGIWESTPISPAFGGTGNNNGTNDIQLEVPFRVLNPLAVLVPELTLNVTSASTELTLPEGGKLATLAGEETFTNKRIVKRTSVTTTSATPNINPDLVDAFYITALSVNITDMGTGFAVAPTFDRGQQLEIWIKDNGVSRTIAWGSDWTASTDLPLPTMTSPSVWLYTRFLWSEELLKWVLIEKLNNIV